MNTFLKLTNCQPRIPSLEFKHSVSWSPCYGENWAIIGDNGAGKSVLANIICGKYALKEGTIDYDFQKDSALKVWQNVKMLSFDSVYGLADFRNTYYQQRWYSSENDDMPFVRDMLGENPDENLIKIFNVDDFFDKKINYLSSGELRKFLITKILLEKPRILIIDNPYIGLDVASRELLNISLKELCERDNMQIIFMFSDTENIPDFITNFLVMQDMQVNANGVLTRESLSQYITMDGESNDSNAVVELKDIHIKYGNKVVLDNLNWTICKGEKWALSGRNGSGKSTLLGLINADHPQAYANEITFFGRRRGVGQSIWDVKKKIGYVSPEMHTHYYQNIPAQDVVGSGFYDTIGTITRCNDEQSVICDEWMKRFGIFYLKGHSFIKLSSGEQRLVLLARAFVKNPSLLILDEPLHGLDTRNKIRVRDIIDDYCSSDEVTMIYVSHYQNEFPKCINRYFKL